MTKTLLTKSDFMAFMSCPFELWLKRVRPDLNPPFSEATKRLFAQGNLVDDLARELHPDGFEVEGFNLQGWKNTQDAISKGKTILYQPTVVSDRLSVRADILVKDPSGKGWEIHEVKMSTKVKSEYVYDLAFQRHCFESAGIPITKTFLVHVNNKYVRNGDIEIEKLFESEDITEEALDAILEIKGLIPDAFAVYEWGKELEDLKLSACPDHGKCDVLEPIIEALGKDVSTFLASGSFESAAHIVHTCDIDPKMLPKDLLNVIGPIETPESRWPKYIDKEGIRKDLKQLEYPLHFLDYETFGSPVPAFDGYRPFQHIPFQFSVYVQEKQGGELKNFDFLMEEFSDPAIGLVDGLREAIGPKGSVISWYDPFEKGRNRELAEQVPEHAEFLLSLNERMYDLMLIFKRKNNLYILPEFGGSASLKNVMPVIIPELSYKNLKIQEGGTASASWPILTSDELSSEEKKKLYSDMIDYCRLDVYGMVKILEHLNDIIR